MSSNQVGQGGARGSDEAGALMGIDCLPSASNRPLSASKCPLYASFCKKMPARCKEFPTHCKKRPTLLNNLSALCTICPPCVVLLQPTIAIVDLEYATILMSIVD